jgi:hypothetical protein
MRIVSGKSCRENQNTHFIFGNIFYKKNCAIYEIMWKNMVEPYDKSCPITDLNRPTGFQEAKAPRFLDIGT